MKRAILATAILAGVTQLSLAELKIPRSVFRLTDLEEAKEKAAEKEEPLIFVFTDPGST